MSDTSNLSHPIVESLYDEALVLADEARAVFALGTSAFIEVRDEDQTGDNRSKREVTTRLALSTEGLKTTTRMMHALAWLLNQRALFSGELSQAQVLRHGTLPDDRTPDPEALAMLEPETRELIFRSEQLYLRIERLDARWRTQVEPEAPPHTLTRRIERSFGAAR